MSDLLNLNVLYRLPADGRPICLDDLASILKSTGLACTQPQIAASLGSLCEQGMAVNVAQGLFARADLYDRCADGKLPFSELMARIATTLIHNDSEALEGRITDALRDVAQFTGADRAYVFEYDFGRGLAHYRYEWCAPGISAQTHSHSCFPINDLHADRWLAAHQRGEPVVMNDASNLTNPDFRQELAAQDIKSLITVPIMADAQCIGFIGFDSVRHRRQYSGEDIRLLETLARMFANLHWKEIDRLALARVHDNLDIIVEGAGVGTWIWWMNTGHLEINETWANMLGYARKELEPITIGTWERLAHPEDLAEARELIRQYLDGKLEYYDTHVRMRHKAGHWVLVQTRARLIHRHPAEGAVMVGVHHDVTGLEQTHREVKQLSDIISQSPIVALRWANQPGWPIQYVSPTIERFGYKAEDFENGHVVCHTLVHPDDVDGIEREIAAYIAHGPDEYRQIYRVRHGRGHWIWVENFSWLTRDKSGTVTHINSVLLDITHRKQLEQELQLHATLIDNSEDLVIFLNTDLRYRTVNRGFLKIIGKSIDEVIGRTDAEIFGQGLAQGYIDSYCRHNRRALQLKRGESFLVEDLFPDSRGRDRQFRSRYFPVFDENTSDLLGTAVISIEITDLKRVQAALSDSEHRFRELFEKLPVAITMHEPETGAMLEANKQACRLHGVETLEELKEINIWNQPEPFSPQDALEWNRKAVREGRQSFEWRSITPAGRVFWQSVTLEPIRIDGVLRILAVSIDINEKVLAQQALAQSEARFRGLLEHLPNVAVQGYDQDKRVIFWNQGSEVIYGYSASEAVGRSLIDLLIPQDQQAAFSETLDRWIAGEAAIEPMEIVVRDKQGWRKSVLSSQIIRRSPTGELEFYCVDVDLTAQKLAQQRLELLARVFSHSYDGVVITDRNAVAIEVNDRYCEITGYSRDELLGRTPSMLHSGRHGKAFYRAMREQLATQGHWVGEIWNRKKSGELYPIELRITALKDSDDALANYIANVTDITERLSYEEKLKHVAFYDQLTGLPNRSSVSETLHQAVSRFKYLHAPFAVVFIDLDEFKAINDGHGHEVGDRYLQSVALRLQSILRKGDVAARFGGDEFVLILQNQKSAAPGHPVVFERLLAAMRDPVVLDGKALRLTASFGVTFYPQESEVDADQLVRQADQAMYSAKQHGKNQIVYFDAEFERSIILRNARIAELRQAIEDREMVLHYQPQVDMSTGRVLGMEALVRWNHPTAGLLYPDKFLDLIQEHEQLGLVLSKWVLSQALNDLERIRSQGHDLGISVNTIIPTQESLRAVFLGTLYDILQQHADTPPDLLTLEVVENILIDDLSEATRTLNKIQQLGVRIALDDFGTGFSSLSYLKHLSFDELKIDQEFVQDMLTDREDMSIVQAVVSLSQSFDVSVIGEGVETAQHAEMLLRLGCVRAQGYAISPPLDIDALETWLEEWQPAPSWKEVAPIAPYFYQFIANLSGYAGWIAALKQYFQGQVIEIPDWNFRTYGLAAQLQANADMQSLWRTVQAHEAAMYAAGIAAIGSFQSAGFTPEVEQHLACAVNALRDLQELVWSRLVEPLSPQPHVQQ